MHAFDLADLVARQVRAGEHYLEFLRMPALSAGLYVLPPGSTDPQTAHREDEIYLVASGRGTIRVGTDDRPVAPGSVVYVPAAVPHRFHSITEELRVLVVFTPAETRAP
jgi:mannose-6-phosphate isomerase-like protein (cupin superfamily)